MIVFFSLCRWSAEHCAREGEAAEREHEDDGPEELDALARVVHPGIFFPGG